VRATTALLIGKGGCTETPCASRPWLNTTKGDVDDAIQILDRSFTEVKGQLVWSFGGALPSKNFVEDRREHHAWIFLQRVPPQPLLQPYALLRRALLVLFIAVFAGPLHSQSPAAPNPWSGSPSNSPSCVSMIRLRQSWNIYHANKHGVLLVKLWKRYLLVNIAEQQVFDIDPARSKRREDNVMWSASDLPAEPLEIADWKDRNVAPSNASASASGKRDTFSSFNFPCAPTERLLFEGGWKLLMTTPEIYQFIANEKLGVLGSISADWHSPIRTVGNRCHSRAGNNLRHASELAPRLTI